MKYYWKCDDNSGSVATDSSTQANDINLTGTTWSSDTPANLINAISGLQTNHPQGITTTDVSFAQINKKFLIGFIIKPLMTYNGRAYTIFTMGGINDATRRMAAYLYPDDSPGPTNLEFFIWDITDNVSHITMHNSTIPFSAGVRRFCLLEVDASGVSNLNSTNIKLYVDGVLTDTNTDVTSSCNPANVDMKGTKLQILKYFEQPSDELDGIIDEIFIVDGKLISEMTTFNPVAWYNGGAGIQLY